MLNRLFGSGILPVLGLAKMGDFAEYAQGLKEAGINTLLIEAADDPNDMPLLAATFSCDISIGLLYHGNVEAISQSVLHNISFLVLPHCNTEYLEKSGLGCEIALTCSNENEIKSVLDSGGKIIRTTGVDISSLSSFSSEYDNVSFIPVLDDMEAISPFANNDFVLAIECSWLSKKLEVSEYINEAAAARNTLLGYSFEHMGLNCPDEPQAQRLAALFGKAFGFQGYNLPNSIFIGGMMEITKKKMPGINGHIAIRANNINRSIADLKQKGFKVDMESAGYQNDKFISVYLIKEFGGFGVHLLKR